jgi:hypothetical protein
VAPTDCTADVSEGDSGFVLDYRYELFPQLIVFGGAEADLIQNSGAVRVRALISVSTSGVVQQWLVGRPTHGPDGTERRRTGSANVLRRIEYFRGIAADGSHLWLVHRTEHGASEQENHHCFAVYFLGAPFS